MLFNAAKTAQTKCLHKQMAQHRRANSSRQDPAVHLHLKGKDPFFEDNVLAREDWWFERGVKESIYVKREHTYDVVSPLDSLTTVHNWVHLAQENHMWRPVKSATQKWF